MLDVINRRLQGSEESLVHDKTTRIGDVEAVSPEYRYDVFTRVIEAIEASADDISPARVADVLALTVVMLHPFRDDNGRTARALGLLVRDDYDGVDYESDYAVVTEPRDRARERGSFLVYGYTPWLPKGFNQSDPKAVGDYLTTLLSQDQHGAYISCFGQASLKKPE